jgi:hypothetical protein
MAPIPDVRMDVSAVAEIDERLVLSPASVRPAVRAGFRRTAGYHDGACAAEYLQRLEPSVSIAEARGAEGERLLDEVARQLALGMTYADTIRVAELKTRKDRFDRVRTVVAAGGQAYAKLQLARLTGAAERDERGAALGSAVEEMSAKLKPEGLLARVVWGRLRHEFGIDCRVAVCVD